MENCDTCQNLWLYFPHVTSENNLKPKKISCEVLIKNPQPVVPFRSGQLKCFNFSSAG